MPAKKPVKRRRRNVQPISKPIMPEFKGIPELEGTLTRPLKIKHEKWLTSYRIHHNATLAAIEAGYSPRSAHVTGSRLANDKRLQARITSFGQLGLDVLAKIAATSPNHIAAEKAAEALVNRSYGTPKDNAKDNKTAPVTINLNRISVDPERLPNTSPQQAIDTTKLMPETEIITENVKLTA